MRMEAYHWVVVGAGPTGIATVGLLLDAGVDGRRIGWIDPEFGVGDFGASWRHVMSNTPVESFLKFYRASAALRFDSERPPFFIEKLPAQDQCPLLIAAEPLHWMTGHLKSRVQPIPDRAARLSPNDRQWQVTLASGQQVLAAKVVLAIGGQPKGLSFADLPEIPLTVALHPGRLREQLHETDRLVVFGDGESARSVLRNVAAAKPERVFHFYRSASAVERHLDPDDLVSVRSVPMTPSHLLATIPQCTKAIYAIGFRRRHVDIDGLPADFGYDEDTGVIAPGIFGAGIAFPEIRLHEMGHARHPVAALWPTMKRLQRQLPSW